MYPTCCGGPEFSSFVFGRNYPGQPGQEEHGLVWSCSPQLAKVQAGVGGARG